jgi:serine protease Do
LTSGEFNISEIFRISNILLYLIYEKRRSYHLKLFSMKQYFLRASAIAVMALFSASVFSQDAKDKLKNKLEDGDEVIIIKKGGKDSKTTIEVKDGQMTINGKPLDEYKDDDVVIRKNRHLLNGTRVYSPSPFRGQSWSYGDGNIIEGKEHAYLGISTDRSDNGARITTVHSNTAAEKAGLKEGDVITQIDDTKVEDHSDVTAAIRKHKPEDKVTINYQRDGKDQKTTATLGKQAGAITFTAPKIDIDHDFNFDFENGVRSFYSYGRPRLGIRAQDTEDGKGVKVLSVDEGSAAEKAGIKKDDIITEFEGKGINSADQLADVARSVKDKSSMNVKLTRDGRSQTVEVKIPKKLKTTSL